MLDAMMLQSLEEQLRALYYERECLTERFGVASAEEIVQMVESLESQPHDFYDRYESELTGVLPSNAEGKIFFTQIAPCTNNAMFFGTTKKGVATGALNVCFPYTFTFRMNPTNVTVHMDRDKATGSNWIFVARA